MSQLPKNKNERYFKKLKLDEPQQDLQDDEPLSLVVDRRSKTDHEVDYNKLKYDEPLFIVIGDPESKADKPYRPSDDEDTLEFPGYQKWIPKKEPEEDCDKSKLNELEQVLLDDKPLSLAIDPESKADKPYRPSDDDDTLEFPGYQKWIPKKEHEEDSENSKLNELEQALLDDKPLNLTMSPKPKADQPYPLSDDNDALQLPENLKWLTDRGFRPISPIQNSVIGVVSSPQKLTEYLSDPECSNIHNGISSFDLDNLSYSSEGRE
ncbi:hypothetical protein AWZ03_011281 [Drosophila navojoa]|uniref:Uncharacterized protein n=1 Tax=Drosophila navojoa TaxID=7232 RepID=A0A484B0A9_DRONA|nr:hypothetical protein AWZ03_011281 [Drosophila navojoa]